jgi:hypothetical protein
MKDAVLIIADDNTVSVNGETYKVDARFPEDIRAVRWDPKAKEGFVERRSGDSHAFKKATKFDFGPYLAAWKGAKARASEEQKAAAAARDQKQRDAVAAREKADLERLRAAGATPVEKPKRTRKKRAS